jgi:hypothetical protein
MKILNKLAVLFSLLTASLVNAQTPQFPYTITPLQFNASVSKNIVGSQQLAVPVVVAVPPGTTGAHLFRVYTPVNYAGNVSVKFTISGTQYNGPFESPSALLFDGQSVSITTFVDPTNIPLGTYNVPISIQDVTTNTTQSIGLNLSVIDDRTYTFLPGTTRVVPHIATGFGWRTRLIFNNPNNTPSVLEVRFYTPDGTARAFRLRDGRITSVATQAIPGYGSGEIVIEDPFNNFTVTGSAEIIPILNSPVGVTILYETIPAAGEVPHVAALPATASNSDTLTLAFDATNDLKTGLALLNSLNYAEPVTLQFYEQGGTLLATTTVNLPAKGQTAFLVSDAVPAIRGYSGIIRATTPFRSLTGFALRFDKTGQFIPVTPF